MQGGVEDLQSDAREIVESLGMPDEVLRGREMLEGECVQVVVA